MFSEGGGGGGGGGRHLVSGSVIDSSILQNKSIEKPIYLDVLIASKGYFFISWEHSFFLFLASITFFSKHYLFAYI